MRIHVFDGMQRFFSIFRRYHGGRLLLLTFLLAVLSETHSRNTCMPKWPYHYYLSERCRRREFQDFQAREHVLRPLPVITKVYQGRPKSSFSSAVVTHAGTASAGDVMLVRAG